MALLFGKEFGGIFAVGGFVDDDVLGRGDEAVLYAAVAAEAFLVSAGVEEADVEGVVFLQFGQEDGVGVGVGVVVVFAVAGEAAEEDTLVFAVPVVDGQHDEPLVDAPGVGEGGDEGAVDHVPHFAVVLLLLVEDAVEGGAALADGEAAEFGEDVGFVDFAVGADVFDLREDFFGHVLVVVGGSEGGFAGEAATDVEGVEFGTDALEVAVDVDAFGEFVPVVGGVADAGVDKEMEHLEAELGVGLDLLLVEADDVAVAHAETRGVEVEFGFLLGGDADAYLHGYIGVLQHLVELVVLIHVVEDGHDVVPAVVVKSHDVLQIGESFVTVAYDELVFINQSLIVKFLYQIDVEGRGGLEVDIVLECLLKDETEVAGFGTIAVIVAALIVGLGNGDIEHAFGALYLGGDFGQVGYL